MQSLDLVIREHQEKANRTGNCYLVVDCKGIVKVYPDSPMTYGLIKSIGHKVLSEIGPE